MHLLVRLLSSSRPRTGKGWEVQEQVFLDGQNLHGSAGVTTLVAYPEAGQWHDLEKAAKQAIAAPAEAPFEILVHIKESN